MQFHYLPDTLLMGAPWWLVSLRQSAYVGLSMFFVLSGFILTYIYLGDKGLEPRRFWLARFARVYPLYLLSLLLSAPFWLAAHQPISSQVGTLLTTILMIQAWFPAAANAVNSPAWSLSVEMFFYAAFPFITPVLFRLSTRRLIVSGVALWLAALAVPSFDLIAHPSGHVITFIQRDNWALFVSFNPLLHLPQFLLGVVSGILFSRYRTSVGRRAQVVLLAASGALIVVAMIANSFIPFALMHNGLLAPAFCCLIFGLGLGRVWFARALGHPMLVLLGDASYSIYLLQVPVWLILTSILARVMHKTEAGHGNLVFVFLPLLIAIAVAVFLFVEMPVRRLVLGLFRARRRSISPAFVAVRSAD